ncbi:hypothetical protein [Campylobacter fetus]|uniref:hypothetical protein n=1 Tax=Campylobacter fetus TaxID=196 RepID=UPI000818BF87|nr:hypothetical protein [Campylobacter fetus]
MAFIQIPNGASEINLGGAWVKVPQGAKEMEIGDDILAKFKAPQQNGAQNTQTQTQNNGYLGGYKEAPQAPNTQNARDLNNKGFSDNLGNIGNKIVNATKQTLNSLNPFDDTKGLTNDERDLKAIQKNLIANGTLNRGTFALNGLFDSKQEAKAKQDNLENEFRKKVESYGLTPTMGKTKQGERRYGVRDKNGQIHDITPNFMQTMSANIGEIAGGVGGAFIPGGAVAKVGAKALSQVARSVVGSTVGSMAGAGGDYAANSQKTDKEMTAKGLRDSVVGGAANSLIGDAAAIGLGKVAVPAIKGTIKGADKAINLMPIVHQLRTQNAGGAKNELIAQVGGKDALEKIKNNAINMNTKIDVADGSTMAKMAKDKLGEVSDGISSSKLPQTIKNGTSSISQKTNQTIDFLQNAFLKNGEITDLQETALIAARANPRIAQVLAQTIQESPEVANNLSKIISKDSNNIIEFLNKLTNDTDTVENTAKNYTNAVKNDFSEMMDTLASRYDGVYTTVPGNEAGSEFMQNISYLKNSVWDGMPNQRLNQILANLNNGKAIDMKGINDLRAELNRIIDTTSDTNVKYIANNVKNYIQSDILDDILTKMPLSDEAKALYKNSVKEYRDMKTIIDSSWYKNVADIDKGESSIINSMGKVLDENVPNNTVDMFLSKLNDKEVSSVELNLLKKSLDEYTAIMDNGNKIVDIERILNTLKNKSFRSSEAKAFIDLLETLQPIIGQDKVLFGSMAKFKNGEKLSQGISQNPLSRFQTMLANQTIKTALRLLPIIGRKPALIHHLKQAGLKATNYNGFMHQLSLTANNPTVEKGIRAELNAFLKSAENEPNNPNSGGSPKPNSSNQASAIPKGDIAPTNLYKEATNDLRDFAKQNGFTFPQYYKIADLEFLKSEIDSLFTWALANNHNKEALSLVAKYRNALENMQETTANIAKGNNFVITDKGADPKSDFNVKISQNPQINDYFGTDFDELSANLFILRNKHAEMFKSEADVFRTIIEIKNNPNRYYKNNRPDMDLITKDLQDGKLGKLSIVAKGDNAGKVGHVSISSKGKQETDRLNRRNADNLAVGAPYPTLRSTDINQGGQTAGADAHLPSNADIIPQSTSKKQILQSAKSKIANKEELNLEEKKTLVEERRAEIKAKKEAKQKAEQEDKTSVINEKPVDNLPNLGKNEQNVPKTSTNLDNKFNQGVNELNKIDYNSLNDTQKNVYDVFMGNKSQTILKVSDIDDLATLEQGSRNVGARKIMIKHAGVEKTGGLNGNELVDIENILLKGKIDKDSFEMRENSLRYAYNLENNGVKYSVVIDEFNNGKKIFDYYSDRNFIDKDKAANIKQQPDPNAALSNTDIIPQFVKDYNLDDFKWDNGLKPKKAATKETVKQIRNIQAKFKALSPKQKAEIRKHLIDKS